jgi:hypothetical protein
VSRTASGGDYFSPWIAVTGGEAYCASLSLRWAGTGAMPFIGVQLTNTAPIWIVGSGYTDVWGPVREVSPSDMGWQQFGVTIQVPPGATAARFAVELWSGVVYGGENGARFDGFALTAGACS